MPRQDRQICPSTTISDAGVRLGVSERLVKGAQSLSQRAMVAAKLVNTPDHRPEIDKRANLHSSADAATRLGVSERLVNGKTGKFAPLRYRGVPSVG